VFGIDRAMFASNRCRAIVACLLLLVVSFSHAGTYSDGMKAYMDGNFELAQILWLKGAKESDAKAMFNLGLLHEQGKIANAESAKADNWYRLAGKHGYSPADFHLANRKLQSDSEADRQEAESLLQRAAARKFVPAIKLLGKFRNRGNNEPVVIDLDTRIDESLEDSVVIGGGAVSQEIRIERYLTEVWIKSKSASNWTIQMLAFQDQSKVREFIDQHQLQKSAAYFIEKNDSGVFYKLIYGSFDSKQQADLAREQLSDELKQYGPWLRTMASVHKVIESQ